MRRVALVTGGTRGIGLGIAQALAAEGFDLALSGLREACEVGEALDGLRACGVGALYCRSDVSVAAEREALLGAVRERYGALHVLVNNAGVAPAVRADVLEATEQSFERVLRVNLQGPYFLSQAAARWMVRQRQAAGDGYRGCLVNVGSVSAEVASLGRGEYCVSKAGVAMMTQLFASRLGEYGIPVYEVRPGLIRTDMTAPVAAAYEARIAETPLLVQRRWGQPADVGRAVAMLARGELPYSTGQVVHVDGGLTLRRL